MKTFWMSFSDPDRPKGQRFLGVAIVEVTDEDAANALIELTFSHPMALPGAEWIAAAIRKAWAMGCNPGGEVGSREIEPELLYHLHDTPRHQLLHKADLMALGHVSA